MLLMAVLADYSYELRISFFIIRFIYKFFVIYAVVVCAVPVRFDPINRDAKLSLAS